MRGTDQPQTAMFSCLSVEDRIPAEHPLRAMHALIMPSLTALSPRFAPLYARMGRPSIPPERLLRAVRLQVLYTIRSEQQLDLPRKSGRAHDRNHAGICCCPSYSAGLT